MPPPDAHHNDTKPARRRGKRQPWAALIVLVCVVASAHLWLTFEISKEMQALANPGDEITRMEATYVTEVKLSTPPVASPVVAAIPTPAATAPSPKVNQKAKRVPRPVQSASAPPEPPASAPSAAMAADSTSDVVADAAQAAHEAASQPPSAPDTPASTPATEAAPPAVASATAAASAPVFVWPKATRVTYKAVGDYRGPIYGNASVEWVRQERRYQVRLDISLGPIGAWRAISEGEIIPEGLYPRRQDNSNRLLIRNSPVRSIVFEDKEVVLASGKRVPRVPGMQDAASQFIQLAYRFIVNPGLLKVGNSIEMPLALNNRVETLAYDVINEEVLRTPVGEVQTFHVKPRRMVAEKTAFSAEIWFAPGLQYLPVRILAHFDDKTYLDMQMERAPQQSPGEGQ